MADKPVRYVIRYSGHVQGVGFRMTSVMQAHGLDIHGFVRNEPDGSVLMDVEGPRRDVNELMQRIAICMDRHIEETLVDPRPARGAEGGMTISY